MLEAIKIQNFRCLKSVDVELRPLTVLLGPNDSGKSAFLDALSKLSEQEPGYGDLNDFWRKETAGQSISLWGRHAEGEAFIRLAGDPHKRKWAREGANRAIIPAQCFRLPSTGVLMESPGYEDTGNPPTLDQWGSNVPTLLDFLLRRHPQRFQRVVEAMRALVPGFQYLQIGTPISASRSVDFEIENGLVISGSRASAGLRLLLFFLALAHHPTPPKLVMIEEPENGLHPRRLGDVVKLLRGVTTGEFGAPPVQVILTTHSPYLLDFIDLSQDQVLVFRRCDDGSRTADPVDRSGIERFLGEYKLGEVWFNAGEEGLVEQPL